MKKILLLVLILSTMLLIACGNKTFSKAPEEHLMDSFKEMSNMTSQQVSGKLNFDIDYDAMQEEFDDPSFTPEIAELFNNLSMQFNMSMIKDKEAFNLDMSYGFDILYQDYSLLELLMFLNNEEIGMAIPNFYDKALIVDLETILQAVSEELMFDLDSVDFKKYLSLLMDESRAERAGIDQEKYEAIIKEHFKDRLEFIEDKNDTFGIGENKIEEEAKVYEYQFTFDGYFELIQSIIEEAKDDAALKSYLVDLMNDMLDLFESSGDYQLFGLTESDLEEARLGIETFESEYAVIMSEALEEFDNSLELMMEDLTSDELYEDTMEDMTMLFYLTEDNQMRRISMEMNIEGMGYTIQYDYTPLKDDKMPHTDMERVNIMDFINLENPEEIMNQEVLAETVKDFLLQAINVLSTDEGYLALYDDLKVFESELGMDPSTIPMLLGMAKSYVENMSIEDMMEYFDSMMNPYSYDDYDDYDDSDWDTGYSDASLDSVGFITEYDINYDPTAYRIYDNLNDVSSIYDVPLMTFDGENSGIETSFEEAVNQDLSLIIVYGSSYVDLLESYAYDYPETQFIYLGNDLYDIGFNIITTEFYNEEVAYVAGYLAGLSTETGTIGFMGGYENDYYKNFEVAFSDGAIAANNEVYVLTSYTNDLTNYDLGYSLAEELVSDGADLLYSVSGLANYGMIDYASENDILFIEENNEDTSSLPGYLTSTMIDYEYIFFELFDNYQMYGVEGNFYSYGLYDDVLYLTEGNIAEEHLDSLFQVIRDIQDGTLFIPIYSSSDY